MVKTIFTKKNIIFFIVSSIFTLLLQIVTFLNIEIEAGSTKFWIMIAITNLIGFVVGHFFKKNYNLFFKEK